MPIHIIKDDEAATRKRNRDIRGLIGWGAILLGMIALFKYYPPEQMAGDLRGIYRDIVDIVTKRAA